MYDKFILMQKNEPIFPGYFAFYQIATNEYLEFDVPGVSTLVHFSSL